ncbi:MAG: undecaprenyldiphospho-muramoylpentapeptide beta-N-acetylglucosaminyltransferase [Betaproteobacteria bacterium]|nr:MAG: undecaprenyldiphospho-muramoylpentapeptide beta-N-acetylglucosaminyltransferase [Betaproteobacteria bacterium]
MNRHALIMAGGTGGHVIPALAVARVLRARGWRISWLGTATGIEASLVPAQGIPLETLSMAGVRGKGMLRLTLLPLHLLRAFWQALRIMRRVRPTVVLGMGGYAAFPGGMMAALLGKPLAIHEQNARAGMTNRVLSCVADRVLLGLPGAFIGRGRICQVAATWLGNPVRAEIAALPDAAVRMAGRDGPLRVLVIGGSLGAAALNTLVPQALALLPAETRPLVRHQAGAKHLADLQQNYAVAGVAGECLAFIEDMAAAYAWADVVICRAGASTVSEIAAAGVAAGFVPFPHAVDDHQTANARFLVDDAAAWLLPQADLTAAGLAAWLSGLTRPLLVERATRARAWARPDAAARVADQIEEIAR